MSNKTIPLDKVHSEIAKINLSPKLEELLGNYSDWLFELLDDGSIFRHNGFHDYVLGTDTGILFEFLVENNIGIRPSGFEFYLTEEDSESTEESEESNCSEVVGQK